MQQLIELLDVCDWRSFKSGQTAYGSEDAASLPQGYHYREGMSTVQVTDTLSMRSITVARGREGDPTQHVMGQRSTDGGKTWGEWFPIEPEGPPMSQYGGFVKHPKTGRVYFIYALGAPEAAPRLADGSPFRGHPHHVGSVVMRYVQPDGTFSERFPLRIPNTEIDETNVFKGKYQAFYIRPAPTMLIGDDGLGWYAKLGPEVDVGQGEAFLLRFVGYAKNDALHELPIELLPEGKRGIRAPGSPSVAEFGPIHVDERDMYFKFRTTAGYAGLAESHDGGRTVTAGFMRYSPGGRYVKNPEGPLAGTKDGQGRIFLTFYNNSEAKPRFGGRDLVWVSGIRLGAGGLEVTEPELLVYRADQQGASPRQDTRLNCGVFTETAEGVVSRCSDKLEARTVRLPAGFLDMIAGQFDRKDVPVEGLAVYAEKPGATLDVGALALPVDKGGVTIDLTLAAEAAGTIIDASDGSKGLRLDRLPGGAVRFTLADGQKTLTLDSDPGAMDNKAPHRVGIVVDGYARLISMVVDGHLQDGGSARGRGTVRIPLDFGALALPASWRIGAAEQVREVRVYGRMLFTTELVGLHRR